MRASDGLNGSDPVRSGGSNVNNGMMNGIYFELSDSFASRSPFAENILRE